MSNPLKKVVKGVKKVFKKVVKVVKKVVSSKVFKAVAIATAVYFTAGAAAGYLGAAGTASTAAAATGTAATTAASTAGALAPITTGVPAAVAGAGTSIGSAVTGAISGTVAKAASMTAGQALLGSAVLTTGGNMISAYAKGKKEEELINERKRNSRHQLDTYGLYDDAQRRAGRVDTDAQGRTEYANSPIAKVQNVEKKPQHFYNASNDSWAPVQRVARNTNKNVNATARDTQVNV